MHFYSESKDNITATYLPVSVQSPILQSWSCVDCGFVGKGRNTSDSLNAVYKHVEKELVAAILKDYMVGSGNKMDKLLLHFSWKRTVPGIYLGDSLKTNMLSLQLFN